MGKTVSNVAAGIGRFVQAAMVAVLVPLIIGLLQGILSELEMAGSPSSPFRAWIGWGFATYVGSHLMLYRPAPLFKASHRLFSSLAVWLFGGQVASVDRQSGGGGGKGKSAKGGKGEKREASSQGSTLVAFSPYVIPLYLMLASAAGLLLRQWVERRLIDGPVSFLIGVTIAFHWLMTADDLQQQRDRWHLETYLLAIGLVFALTLLIGGLCLPWAIPEFSFIRALADWFARTQSLYTTITKHLFF